MKCAVIACCGLLLWLTGCAGNGQTNPYALSARCSECGTEWSNNLMNRTDNGYGSRHYWATREDVRQMTMLGRYTTPEASARVNSLDGSRDDYWKSYPSFQRGLDIGK